MNKYILTLVDNELNPEKYTKEELVKSRRQYLDPIFDSVYRSDFDNYFELTAENKQDYIDQVNKDNAVRELDLITKAVCQFNGVWSVKEAIAIFATNSGELYYLCTENYNMCKASNSYKHVALEPEFNAHMKELSGCPIALREWQEGLKAQDKPTSNIVYHEGKGYEIGKGYQCCETSRIGELLVINSSRTHPFVIGFYDGFSTTTTPCKLINKITLEIGTITEQPIELINGKAYQFDVRGKGLTRCGIYNKFDKKLHVGAEHYFDLLSATNIKPLTLAK